MKLSNYVLLENGSIQKVKLNQEYRGFRYKNKKLYMDYLERIKGGYAYITSKVIATAETKKELEEIQKARLKEVLSDE